MIRDVDRKESVKVGFRRIHYWLTGDFLPGVSNHNIQLSEFLKGS